MTYISQWSDGVKPVGANIAAIKAKTDIIEPAILAWDVKTLHPVPNAIQGTWVIANYPQLLGVVYANDATHALNDEFRLAFYARTIAAMVLNLRVITNTTEGIITVYIDGVTQGTIDLYSAIQVYNVIKTISITPARVGMNILALKITAKNALSSDYYGYFSEIWV